VRGHAGQSGTITLHAESDPLQGTRIPLQVESAPPTGEPNE
jgi:hypothetical protein